MTEQSEAPARIDLRPPGARTDRSSLLLAIGTWGVGMLYHATGFDRRWIPFDEGTLGQSALRVLQGEVPHRDFDAMYTGLFDYVHAAAMHLFGVHLLTPRLVMLVAVALWLPAVWSIARRLVGSSVGASFLTALALLMGPPNYPAAMPSWYNLFCATWGLWALLRWMDGRRPAWLVLVGVFAGISILSKITGLYLLAGSLFLVLHFEALRVGPDQAGRSRSGRGAFRAFAAAAVLFLLALQTAVVWPQMSAATWLSYVLPSAILGATLVWHAGRVEDGRGALEQTAYGWGAVVCGTLLPVLPFLVWYAAAGGLADLYRGVFVLPVERFTAAAIPVPPLSRTWTILVPIVLMMMGSVIGARARNLLAVAIICGAAGLLLNMGPGLYVGVFSSLLLLVPVVAVAGAASIVLGRSVRSGPVLATLWVLALIHLIRYPFAGPIYFTYVAPLAVLAAGGVLAALAPRDDLALGRPRLRPVLGAVGLAYAVFFVTGPNRGGLFGPLPPPVEAPLPMERGRLVVPLVEAEEYAHLVQVVRRLAEGRYVYATPDAPEVSFLTGLDNPTRALFEIFEDDATRSERTLRELRAHEVDVIVVNTRARFSSIPADLVAALSAEYPYQTRVGRFLVRSKKQP